MAPPKPLRGLTGGDGEYVKAVIAGIDGPVLLVGHSYAGSVITAAGMADNVVGLVYIFGFGLDEGKTRPNPAPPARVWRFTEAEPTPAWRSRPAWPVLPTADLCIDPGVHNFSYQRMGAAATEGEGPPTS
jgi:hypothetical protein